VVQILTGLGMQVHAIAEGWQVTAPSWRFDMAIEADLIEELARMYGLDNLPKLPLSATNIAPSSRNQSTQPLKNLLVAKGYQEAITYSFVDGKEQVLVEPNIEGINLANPIAETLGQMRVSLWTGLLSALRYNLNRQVKRIRFFETGLRFLPEYDAQNLPTQIQTLAGIACGAAQEVQWSSSARPVDFYDVKGDLEVLFAQAGIANEIEFKAEKHPALHPGQSAGIYYQQKQVGWLGNLHPLLANQLDIEANVVLFSVDLSVLTQPTAMSAFAGLSKFPLVKRDVALVVDHAVSYQQLRELALSVKRDWYLGVTLFDVYAGKGLQEGQKSLALSLHFQDLHRTLTDQEIEACVNEVVSVVSQVTGAQLRN
jgi:phenylalanyl-tRNA synthetase beta chain